MRAALLTFVLFSACLAIGQGIAVKKLPRFEEYPVHESWTGAPPAIRFRSRPERMFRTQFRNAALMPPNFAGHFRVATWGCGTACLSGGIVDLSSGRILALPYPVWRVGATGAQKVWALCGFVSGGEYDEVAQTRPDSNLLILNCADSYGKDEGTYLHTSYYLFQNGRFRKIADHVGDERVF